MTNDYPPPAPATITKNRKPYIIGGIIAFFLIVGTIANVADPVEPATTTPIATTAPTTTESPTTTTEPASPLELWVAEHGIESAAIMAELGAYSELAGDAIATSDAATLWLTCDMAVDYLDDAERDPVSRDPNAPILWGKTLGYWKMGFRACTDADLEAAADYLAMGTEALGELNDLIDSVDL